MAGWAVQVRLPHVAVEVRPKSTYQDRNRLLNFPRWVAWSSDDGSSWVIVELTAPKPSEIRLRHSTCRRGLIRAKQVGDRPEVWSINLPSPDPETGAPPLADVLRD